MKILVLSFFLTVALAACYPSKYVSVLSKRDPLPDTTKVRIIGVGQTLPNSAVLLGQLVVGDQQYDRKYCTYEEVVREALKETLHIGGNVFQITDHAVPAPRGPHCHIIKGDVYFLADQN